MMDNLHWTHAVKVVAMLVMLAAIAVMMSGSPERYIYGGF